MQQQTEQQKKISESDKAQVLMAKLSNLAYKNIRIYKNGQKLFKNNNLLDWEYFQPEDIAQGLRSKIFSAVNNTSKEIVVVFKGFEPIPSFDIESIVNDWCVSDINLVIGRIPKQFYDAYNYLNSVKSSTTADFKIFLTGHSLGGSLVQLLCSLSENKQITGYTFNAYGAKHLLSSIEQEGYSIGSDFSNINNFSIEVDLVSNQNEHIGNVFVVKYEKSFVKTIFSIISELPKILTDIPFKIIKSIRYYFNTVKWFFVKINGHLMNNFTSEFKYEKYSKEEIN